MPKPVSLNYLSAADSDFWKEGPLLVVRLRNDVSAVCIQCGRPSSGKPIRVRLHKPSQSDWSTPDANSGLPIFISFLCFLVVVLTIIFDFVNLVRSINCWIAVGLCEEHRRRRRLLRTWATGLAATGLTGIVSIFTVGRSLAGGQVRTDFLVVAITLSATTLVVAAVLAGRVHTLALDRKSDGVLWISGAGQAFLASVPSKSTMATG